ncbi:hypothetical protein SF12_06315, partial [Streptomyces sp. MBRL 601]
GDGGAHRPAARPRRLARDVDLLLGALLRLGLRLLGLGLLLLGGLAGFCAGSAAASPSASPVRALEVARRFGLAASGSLLAGAAAPPPACASLMTSISWLLRIRAVP